MSFFLIYRTGHNLPGCLPDDPDSVHRSLSWESARDVLLDELSELESDAAGRQEQCDETDPDGALEAAELVEAAQNAHQALEAAEVGSDFQVYLDGRSYWLEGSDPVDDDEERAAALASLEETELSDIEQSSHDSCTFEIGRSEYRVLTDDEADEAVEEYIRESVWAFRPEFLVGFMAEGIDVETVQAIQGERCEDANAPLLALVEAGQGFDAFMADAILSDGRGHFLNHYDGEERESGDYYIYQVN